jgi:hypothetical protein
MVSQHRPQSLELSQLDDGNNSAIQVGSFRLIEIPMSEILDDGLCLGMRNAGHLDKIKQPRLLLRLTFHAFARTSS